MLVIITDTMARAADFRIYLRNVATMMWQPEGVSDIVTDAVKAQARITVGTDHDEQQLRLENYLEEKMTFRKDSL